MRRSLRGVIPSPNIRDHPQTYELLNRAADPYDVVGAALLELRDWTYATVVDVGCGSGYHLPWLAGVAAQVVGVEPERSLADLSRRRTRRLPNVEVRQATAQALPLADHSADVVHSRWAYFFGPGCEPGLAESRRVLRRGGLQVIVDVDLTAPRSGYARWFRQAWPGVDVTQVEAFWARLGFHRRQLEVPWIFDRHEDLAAVLDIEFPPAVARAAIQDSPGREITVGQVLRWRWQA